MSLLEDILGTIREDAPVQRVSAGRNWIALRGRYCGLASTLGSGDDATSIDIQSLDGRSARDVAHLALPEKPLDAAVGMAAVNSLIEVDESLCAERNGRDVFWKTRRTRALSSWVTSRLCPNCSELPDIFPCWSCAPDQAICRQAVRQG